MTDLFFVDANVLVYARDRRDAAKRECARAWLERLWTERNGRTSVQALSEYYVAVTRKLKPAVPAADAWDDVCAFFNWQPQGVDEALLRRSREIEQRYRLSWWDSLIVAAAQIQVCSLLLSEDLQDGGVYGSVTVRSPFTLSAHEAIAAYEIGASTTSPHPRRGRPRKSTSLRTSI